jgi:hemerythrin superfamily protein
MLAEPTSNEERTMARQPDVLTLLRQDHRKVDDLFKRFENSGERAYKAKRKLVDQIINELSIHAAIEEEVFYPGVRERMQQSQADVLESLEEHHLVKVTLSELEGLDPGDERFDAKVMVMMESVRHHAKEEEEGQLFPRVRKAFTPAELREMGARLEQARKRAPTRPHPHAPDEPPGNSLAAPVSALLDRGRDIVRKVL